MDTLKDYSNFPVDINNSGKVTGFLQVSNGDNHAFITGPNGTGMTDLGTLGGNYSNAAAINESGHVIGRAGNIGVDALYFHAFITGPDGIDMTNLGTLGRVYSEALGLNDNGEAVGWVETVDGDSHAFLFSHGGITDLSLLAPVVAAGWQITSAVDINNNGQIVGVGINSTGVAEAFLLSYTPDTVFDPQSIFIPPPPLPPVPEPEAYMMLLVGLGFMGMIAVWRKETTG